jgi:hypothetical protein
LSEKLESVRAIISNQTQESRNPCIIQNKFALSPFPSLHSIPIQGRQHQSCHYPFQIHRIKTTGINHFSTSSRLSYANPTSFPPPSLSHNSTSTATTSCRTPCTKPHRYVLPLIVPIPLLSLNIHNLRLWLALILCLSLSVSALLLPSIIVFCLMCGEFRLLLVSLLRLGGIARGFGRAGSGVALPEGTLRFGGCHFLDVMKRFGKKER